MLGYRMLNNAWAEPPSERLQNAVQKVLQRDSAAEAILEIERRQHISQHGRICSNCNVVLSKAAAKKCNGCRRVYYCSTQCQRAAWHDHRQICTDTIPTITCHAVILLPDHRCSFLYQEWFESNPHASRPPVGIRIISRDTFKAWLGERKYEKTMASLAIYGYPKLNLASVLEGFPASRLAADRLSRA